MKKGDSGWRWVEVVTAEEMEGREGKGMVLLLVVVAWMISCQNHKATCERIAMMILSMARQGSRNWFWTKIGAGRGATPDGDPGTAAASCRSRTEKKVNE